MDSIKFKKLVNETFAKNIRQLNWKGSGFKYYKADPNHVVNIFGIQGNWMGGSVCCETAIHFDFMPDLAHTKIDITKTTYASCIIRKRLSPKGEGDFHWSFRDKEEANLESIKQIWDSFRTHGLSFYSDFEQFPKPFDSIQPADIENSTNYKVLGKYYVMNHIEFAWMLKEINHFIDRKGKAQEFAELGLKMAFAHADEMAKKFKGKRAQDDLQNYRNIYLRMFKDKRLT